MQFTFVIQQRAYKCLSGCHAACHLVRCEIKLPVSQPVIHIRVHACDEPPQRQLYTVVKSELLTCSYCPWHADLENPCWKTDCSRLVITKKPGWRHRTNLISAPHLANHPSLHPGSTNTESSRELLLSPVAGSIFSSALLILTSLLSKWGYRLQRWNRTCARTVQEDGTVRSLLHSYCSYCSCWLEINESLAAGLSSEITDLAEQQKPFLHCLNIWIIFMPFSPNSLETPACRFDYISRIYEMNNWLKPMTH